MNINYEFSKIKDSFVRVKTDMKTITEKINENYDDFLFKHNQINLEISNLSHSVIKTLNDFKAQHLHSSSGKIVQSVEILGLKSSIQELKKEIREIQEQNHGINTAINLMKKKEVDVSKVNDKFENYELEIFLLKERLIEKDVEIKQLKNVSEHILKVMDELTSMEIEILNRTN